MTTVTKSNFFMNFGGYVRKNKNKIVLIATAFLFCLNVTSAEKVSSESVEGESIGTCEEVVTSTQSCFQGSSKTEKCCKQACPDTYQFKLTPEKGNFENARQQCALMGGDLITDMLGPRGKRYHGKIRELVSSREVWIGLSDRIDEGVWRFPNNNEIFDTYAAGNVFKWSAGNPSGGNQHCVWVGYKGDGLMDDLECGNDGLYGLCEIEPAEYEFKLTPEKTNFANSRMQCASMGGDLITVNLGPKGKRYHEKIRELVVSRKAWIGLSDRIDEGVWRFPNNHEIFDTYAAGNVFQWAAGDPNNANGEQDCAWVGWTGDGVMDDIECENYRDFQGLCEIETIKYEFKLTPEKSNFENSRMQCASMGGDLITVNLGPKGKRYHEKIRELVSSRHVWIGLEDRITEGEWRFPNNNKIFDTYDAGNVFKWSAGNPSGANQHCVWVGYTGDGLMDDVECGNEGFYGLCEIKDCQ